jgi:TRAP-type C4-dicarboxylate transport system substrate-binding protein
VTSETDTQEFVDADWGGQPWTRIGDAPSVVTTTPSVEDTAVATSVDEAEEFPDGVDQMEMTSDPAIDDEVTLTFVSFEPAGSVFGELLQHFAGAAHAADSTVTIETKFEAAPSEPEATQMILDDTVDGGAMASRVWDTLGITSLRAINTPFLIDSEELMDAVVQSDQADAMLDGLSAAHVTGLALLPVALRHSYGLEEAPLGAEDYAGATMRLPRSETTWALAEALGATPMFGDGDFDVAESDFVFAPGPFGTGNVTWYPRIDTVVISDAAREKLSDDQFEALATAADETLDWALANVPSEATMAATFCTNGGTIVAATDAQIESLHEAAQPVIDSLREDAVTAAAIDAIEALKQDTVAAEPITSCEDVGVA